MKIADWLDFAVKLLDVLTKTSVIVLAIVLTFRHAILKILNSLTGYAAELSSRVTKLTIGETSAEFERAALSVASRALREASTSDGLPTDVAKNLDNVGHQLERFVLGEQTPEAKRVMAGRILWVDDNPDNNLFERLVLKEFGTEIDLATSTAEAREKIAQHHYDVIISDMHREEGGRDVDDAGVELLDKKPADVPLVFYVGNAKSIGRAAVSKAAGVFDRPEALIDRVAWLLTNDQRARRHNGGDGG